MIASDGPLHSEILCFDVHQVSKMKVMYIMRRKVLYTTKQRAHIFKCLVGTYLGIRNNLLSIVTYLLVLVFFL